MKYLSLLFLVICMSWSWAISHSPAPVAETTHVGIQNDLKRLISEYIKENAPEAQGLRFEQFWTQTLNKNQVKAVFSYSFQQGEEGDPRTARIGIEGYALLNRGDDPSGEYDVWSLDSLFVENNRIEFKEGTSIVTSGPQTEK